MARIDYATLREHTLGSGQDGEAVTVNMRALIDKVLARYAGEFTTLRELIQNAADASATDVTIKFQTSPSASVPLPPAGDSGALLKHTMLHHSLRTLVVTNNGQAFRDADWARVKSVAEGNPDETKIGAFGVGFYASFSECDSPLVVSGEKSMAFYWKGNSLYTSHRRLPVESVSSDTSFVLDYRSPTTKMPDWMALCKFLSTCLTFLALGEIKVMVDDWTILTFRKKSAPTSPVPIPSSVRAVDKEKMMQISEIHSQHAQIDASWLNIVGWKPQLDKSNMATVDADVNAVGSHGARNFFSRIVNSIQTNSTARRAAKEEEAVQTAITEDIAGTSQATMFIRVHTAKIKTTVQGQFASELERATKKPPPKQTHVAILTSSLDETEASVSTRQGASSQNVAEMILSALPIKSGQIFIGFPTSQTSGLLAHVSAPSLIPTVERESIDLHSRYIRKWNLGLLSAAGIACRITYIAEMESLKRRLGTAPGTYHKQVEVHKMAQVLPAANHILDQFTFRESTPIARAGEIVRDSFWDCGKTRSIEMISSCGVLPSTDIRIASESLSFVSSLPVVPKSVMTQSKTFIDTLLGLEFLSKITIPDIKRELERQALTEDQLTEFLNWTIKKLNENELDSTGVEALFSDTLVQYKANGSAEAPNLLLELWNIRHFVNVVRLSPDMPLPPDTIPFRFTKGMSNVELQTLSWSELQLVPWLRWLVKETMAGSFSQDVNILDSPAFSSRVLATVSKSWEGLSQSSKETITGLLAPLCMIPTRLGMRKPADAYFPSVKLFDDLPVIVNMNGVKERLMKALGIRKTVELSVIFDRLLRSNAESETNTAWSHVELIKYLVSVWEDIPKQDINQLRDTPLCPAEASGENAKSSAKRYKASDLYEPNDTLRPLGLKVLQWPGHFNAYGPEGKFLRSLGLKVYPPVPDLIDIIADTSEGPNNVRSEIALKYYLEHHYSNNYGNYDLSGVQIPFLPVEGTERRVKPGNCFSDPSAAVFGFSILRKDLQRDATKLGVCEHPSILSCAKIMVRNTPQDKAAAKLQFEYFAKRLPDMSSDIARTLGTTSIVPITAIATNTGEGQNRIRHVAPCDCFIGLDGEYRDIFDYVDFGSQANLFLLKVGSKNEPNLTELTRLVIRDPARIFKTLGVERYLGLLRKMHLNLQDLKKDKELWRAMKETPFLLGYVEQPVVSDAKTGLHQNDGELDEYDDQAVNKQWHLRNAARIAVVDDLISYSLFKAHLVAAPQEEGIEDLYTRLGTPTVSMLIDAVPLLGPTSEDQSAAEMLLKLILERVQLFLHEQPLGTIEHDVKWLEKNLKVQAVQSVSLRRKLRGSSHTNREKRSAAILAGTTSGASTLSITPRFDMWQVSEALASLLITRPKHQTVMVLETFLATRLETLRARGYNVDRVLRKKQAEARVAELERQRIQEEQSRRNANVEAAREAERARAGALAALSKPNAASEPESETEKDTKALMPGTFHDSPDKEKPADRGKPMGLFSSITRSLGLDNKNPSAGASQQSLGDNAGTTSTNDHRGQAPIGGSSTPTIQRPPSSIYDPNALRNQGDRGPQPEPVSDPQNTDHNLVSAIAAGRPYGSENLHFSPRWSQVSEAATYCDPTPGQNLRYIATTSEGLRFYVDDTDPNFDPRAFSNVHVHAIDTFSRILVDLARVFDMPKQNLHIFYDTDQSTIAFNTGGAIFANLRFFGQLHLNALMAAKDLQARTQAMEIATAYWFSTICHELAHNIVGPHDVQHGYYTESFVARYYLPLMQQLIANRTEDGGGNRVVFDSLGKQILVFNDTWNPGELNQSNSVPNASGREAGQFGLGGAVKYVLGLFCGCGSQRKQRSKDEKNEPALLEGIPKLERDPFSEEVRIDEQVIEAEKNESDDETNAWTHWLPPLNGLHFV